MKSVTFYTNLKHFLFIIFLLYITFQPQFLFPFLPPVSSPHLPSAPDPHPHILSLENRRPPWDINQTWHNIIQ